MASKLVLIEKLISEMSLSENTDVSNTLPDELSTETADVSLYRTYNITLNMSAFSNKTETINIPSVFESQIIVPLYVIIFLLAVIGNSLVLITLAQNKRMRTVTNVYLLNLAVSDLLLGVLCMPFTLVGQLLRNFIFGAAMCKLIPYFQAVSVSVGVWTLVAISLERYFAICRPLKSRRWQTQFHAYKMIAVVWTGSLLWNSPILLVSTLKAMRGRGHHKCREEWPSSLSERAYNLFLDAILLLAPLLIMGLAYSLIVSKLWRGLRREMHSSSCQRELERSGSLATMNGVNLANSNSETNSCNTVVTPVRQHRHFLQQSPRHQNTTLNNHTANTTLLPQKQPKRSNLVNNCQETAHPKNRNHNKKGAKSVKMWLFKGMVQVRLPSGSQNRTCYRPTSTLVPPRCPYEAGVPVENETVDCYNEEPPVDSNYTFTRLAIRSNYMDKSIEAKKKVIRMLFVIIVEFFVCWAPLHVLNTVYLFAPEFLYNYVSSTGVALVQLLAYVSSCCNPITYCFMNRRFRQAFLGIFNCYRCNRWCFCCPVSEDDTRNGCHVLKRSGPPRNAPVHSDNSGNESTIYVGRQSILNRSEVVVLEAEDRV